MANSDEKENSFFRNFDEQCIVKSNKKKRPLDNVAKTTNVDQSPIPSSRWLSSIKLQSNSPLHDSPFDLFKIRKRRARTSPSESDSECTYSNKEFCTTTPTRSAFATANLNQENQQDMEVEMNLGSPGTLNQAIENSIQNPNLIGDFSKPCILPTIRGKHEDLPSISPETVVQILTGQYQGNYLIVDCRYPYEYEGGHILGAKNIYTKEALVKELLPQSGDKTKIGGRDAIIFYCEFSSQRAPKMYRFLRGKDREMNAVSYPSLFYPEMYLLEGGYKSFYGNCKNHCDPQGYKTMLDKSNTEDMLHFRAKCKSDTTEYRRTRNKARSGLKF